MVTISSAIGVPVVGSSAAQALTASVGYPVCDVNLVQASTANDEPTEAIIALSLGGAPATTEDCTPNDSYGSGVAITTGDSASSSVAAVAVNGCYSLLEGPATGTVDTQLAGGGVTNCNRAFLANVSVFSDAYGSNIGHTGNGLVSFSLFGDASGSWLAVAPFGNATSVGGIAVGCTSATGPAFWRWCAAWEPYFTPEGRQLVYSTLQTLVSLGLAETQAAINFYNGGLQGPLNSTYGLAGFPSCSAANPGATYTDQFGNQWLCDELYLSSDSILYGWMPVRSDPEFSPPPGVFWNGKKVYLSPSSNNPGPSGCDGYIEDVGARDTAMRTKDVLIARGYKVMVGQGSHIANKNSSNRWVADVPADSRIHIPIASNGGDLRGLSTPCYDDPSRGAGTRIIWESTDGKRLSQEILNRLGPMSPGTPDNLCDNPSPCTGNRDLTELSGTTAVSSYVEMAYHTYRPDMVWLRDQRAAIATTLADSIDAYFP